MELGLLILRVVVGLLFMGHGAQKLFGMFGGYGIEGTGGFFESLGLKPGRFHAFNAGAAEFAGGALLALGLLTPLAAALLIGTMTVAIATVHWSKGVWSSEGGYEYNLVLIAAVFALAATGPGKWSLDNAFSIDANGTAWALAALGAGLIGGVVTLGFGRMQAARAGSGSPTTAT
ncbi:MAG: putative oxidoreductase [Thermoleophilales bacterium]|jgi:putative oxidoreductase|nr:putative oxidoreductase [Thermoleophilales bacterium]